MLYANKNGKQKDEIQGKLKFLTSDYLPCILSFANQGEVRRLHRKKKVNILYSFWFHTPGLEIQTNGASEDKAD